MALSSQPLTKTGGLAGPVDRDALGLTRTPPYSAEPPHTLTTIMAERRWFQPRYRHVPALPPGFTPARRGFLIM